MSTPSPPPNSSPSSVPPTSTNTPPPQPQLPPASPSSQPNANPPQTTPSTSSPPPQSPPPAARAAPPPATVSSPPPDSPVASSPPPPFVTSPPLAPTTSPPPPPTNSTSPPPSAKPPQSSPPPLPSSNPPISSPPPTPPSETPPEASPPPPTLKPPVNSPPPPSSLPPTNSPPPPASPSKPPQNSPPPPASEPPQNSPPPPASEPPQNSPPPPASKPPQNSPPPPASKPPQNSPPPPAFVPPQSSPPPPAANPPKSSPPPPASEPPSTSPPPPRLTLPPTALPAPPPSNSTPKSSPPPPNIRLTPPPPPSGVSPPSPFPSPSPPSPTQTSVPPSGSVTPSSIGSNGVSTGVVVAISAAVGLLVLSIVVLLVWCIMKRKRKTSGLNGGYIMPSPFGSSPKSDSSFTKKAHSSAPLIGTGSGSDFVSSPTEPGGLGNSRSWFTYEELFVATNGFSAQNLLGEGGFGFVYKGYLPDGREIAVKHLKIGGGQGEREFKAEVEIISRIHHRHLVSLVGYCLAENRRLLIYEYVPNDTLYFHLHGVGEGWSVMDWARRVKVAAGAARGIAYLHEDCHPRIIHRDIKSSNILLDTNFEARVSDFGLAKLAIDADTHITTRVMGTFGYMAPEYASSGKLTEKSDVYSFGVVLLELITGRKPVDASQPLGDESLVEWARPLLSDALDSEQFDNLADPRLEKNYLRSEMFRMIEAAAACVRHSAVKRPRMGQVVRALDSVAASDLTNGMRPGESEVFYSAHQSAEIRSFQRMAFGSQDYSTDYFSQSSLNS